VLTGYSTAQSWPQVSGRGPTFRITRGSLFATAVGVASGVGSGDDDGDDDASAASPPGRLGYAFFPSGDADLATAVPVGVPWLLAGLRTRSVMELDGTKALRPEDDCALRGGSSRASRADVRSSHGGCFVSVIPPSEGRGPRRFLVASFSSYAP
jgi:hypothetical protein